MSDYRYLFPYEKIPCGARVLIYGAGVLGQEYLKQMLITGYCKVIGFADRNFADYPPLVVPVYSPEMINELVFDYVVIALRGAFGLTEIQRVLMNQGIREEKIVYVFERAECMPHLLAEAEIVPDYAAAYQTNQMAFALYLTGGLGDMVCQKRFVIELLRFVPDAGIDIYTTQNAAFLRWLYSDMVQVRNIVSDAGTLYADRKEMYALGISVYGCQFLSVDTFSSSHFAKTEKDFIKKIESLRKQTEEEGQSLAIPHAVATGRHVYNGQDCYTWFNHQGTFSIDDRYVSIPIGEEIEASFLELGLGCYITVNTGNGSSKEGKSIAKTWPLKRFEKTMQLFKTKYPTVTVVQIGAADGEKLKNADVHFMGKEFGLVACILKNALFHFDIEGGLVHLASQLGTKCVVLFGPTPMKYYAYPQNINVCQGDCHDCYGLYLSTDCCVRHMEKPICMYAITPEIVMNKIITYMETVEKKN